jgi:hypothetical protein
MLLLYEVKSILNIFLDKNVYMYLFITNQFMHKKFIITKFIILKFIFEYINVCKKSLYVTRFICNNYTC